MTTRYRQPRHWTYHEEKLRKAVFIRDNYECQIRLPGCLGTATHIDHRHSKLWGGRATLDNLQAACKPCNLKKGSRSMATIGSFSNHGAPRTRPLRKIPPQDSRWTPKVRDYTRDAPEAAEE